MFSAKIWCFLIDLVWSGIADSLSSLVSVWWEHPKLVDNLNEFRRVAARLYPIAL